MWTESDTESNAEYDEGRSGDDSAAPFVCVAPGYTEAGEASANQPTMSSFSSVAVAAKIRKRSVVRVSDT
ncbi:hypothetical protein BSP239C_00914 [Brevibacterium sp. 239c]|nr:hypothetical protein BSP239C_00914 [Brevibacterium sp. 239c]